MAIRTNKGCDKMKANIKETLNLNNNENFVTPYTLGLVLKSSSSGGGYRIGDVIISINEENPSVKYGGKWELLCPGRTLVCIDTSQTEFNTIRQTGGSKYLQAHNHCIRVAVTNGGNAGNSRSAFATNSEWWGGDQNYDTNNRTNYVGTGDSGNLQPYMVVYMWVRVS